MDSPCTASPLVSCPIDILSNITSYLLIKDILSLYCTDKGHLRPRLVQHGGVKRLEMKYLTGAQVGTSTSYPMFSSRFRRLESLILRFPIRIPKIFVVGSFLYLPRSLTFLEMRFEYSMTAWLQPSEVSGNNDDGPFNELFKPIYMDNLLPNLRTLILASSNTIQFTPTAPPRTARLEHVEPYFDPPLRAVMPPDVRSMISKHLELKMQMKWTSEMRAKWLQHLPKSLTAIQLNCCHPDIFALLPPHLTSIAFSGSFSAVPKLSSIPEVLRDSIAVLEMPVVMDGFPRPIDVPFPPHLTDLTVTSGYCNIPSELIDFLPQELTSLKLPLNSFVSSLSSFPSSLKRLHVGDCPLSDLIRSIPPSLTELSFNGRTGGLKLLADLPLSLHTLIVCGDADISDEIISILPRHLLHLTIEGHNHSSLTEASMFLLPQSLLILHLGNCSQRLPNQSIQAIPRSVTSLQLSSSLLSDAMVEHLPPNLTHLRLDTCRQVTDAIVPLLPKSITSFNMIQLMATGALLKEGIQRLTTSEVSDSILSHLHPEIRHSKNLYLNQKLYFDYNTLAQIPTTVTEVNYPGRGVHFNQLLPLKNLVSLILPECNAYPITNLSYSMPSLTILSLPKLNERGHIVCHLPPNLTQLDLSTSSFQDVPAAQFPPKLTILKAYTCDANAMQKLAGLTALTDLTIASYDHSHTDSLSTYLPKSLKSLYLGHARGLKNTALTDLPPTLTSLRLPESSFTNDCLFHLPDSVTKFQVATFSWDSFDHFAPPKHEMREFSSPESCIEFVAAYKSNDSRSSSSSPPPGDATTNSTSVTSSVRTMLQKVDATTILPQFGDALAIWLPLSLTSLKLTENHSSITNKFVISLPRSIIALDMAKQSSGLTPECALYLPPSLKTLALWAAESTEASFIECLPRTITDLELVRMPGRLNAAKADALPPGLVRLRLGLTIVGNDVLRKLPRTIRSLDLANGPFINDDGVPLLPPQLERLWLPTSHLTPKCVDSLPTTITSLSLGAGCTVSPAFIFAKQQ